MFLLLQAVLGLTIDAPIGLVQLTRPTLPAGLDQVSIHGLELCGGSLDLLVERSGDALELRVLRGCDGVDVQVL